MSEFVNSNGAIVEVGNVEFNGKSFSAIGSVDDRASGVVCGYVHKENDGSYSLVSWDGSKTFCQLTNTSKWKTSRSYISSHQFAWTTVIDGIKYNGRNGGEGLYLCMRKSKRS
jgi:hypothetical protein